MYRILSHTVGGSKRTITSPNQDAFKVMDLDRFIVGCVSDGVSSSAKGGLAAQTACNIFVDYCERNLCKGKLLNDAGQLAANAVQFANEKVVRKTPNQSGLCTIVAVIIDKEEKRIEIVNSGDSPAFFRHNGQFSQVATFDTTSIPVTIGGKTVIQNGMIVTSSALTDCLGMETFATHMKTIQYDAGDVLVLCSDGVEQKDIKNLLQRDPWYIDVEDYEKAVSCWSVENNDDATAVTILLDRADINYRISDQLVNYSKLDFNEKYQILHQLENLKERPKDLLHDCFSVEKDQDLRIRIFTLISQYLEHEELTKMADIAAVQNQHKLLRNISHYLSIPKSLPK